MLLLPRIASLGRARLFFRKLYRKATMRCLAYLPVRLKRRQRRGAVRRILCFYLTKLTLPSCATLPGHAKCQGETWRIALGASFWTGVFPSGAVRCCFLPGTLCGLCSLPWLECTVLIGELHGADGVYDCDFDVQVRT
jgi:hypothetical protein